MTPRNRRQSIGPVLLLAVIAAIGACTEVGTSPNTAVAISFDTLPSPSVVYGDTLRDIDGVAAPLTAHAYNADGNKIPNAPIQYLLQGRDSVGVVDPVTKFLVATADTNVKQIRITAQVGNIPFPPRVLEVVPLPDSVDRGEGVDRARQDTLRYPGTDTLGVLSAPLSLRVLDRTDTAGPVVVRGVRSWPVRYRLVSPIRADTLISIVNEAGGLSTLDTTGTDGVASRRLRLRRRTGLATDVPDTVVVEATARNRNGALKGAPLRYVIILQKTS